MKCYRNSKFRHLPLFLRGLTLVARMLAGFAVLVVPHGGCDWPFAPDAQDAGNPIPDVPRADCDSLVGGRPLSPEAVEAAPGYVDELQSLDLASLPEQIDVASLDVKDRARVAYALETPSHTLGNTLDRDTLLASGEMGKAVLASFYPRDGGAVEFDLDFFRRGFHAFYACTRRLPLTLDGFQALYGVIADIPRRQIAFSIPKQSPRWLREDPENHIYVAETEDADGGVREFEIILDNRRADEALDFLVYDADGSLMDRSEFGTVTGGTVVSAVPFACMSCHVEFNEQTYDVILPVDL